MHKKPFYWLTGRGAGTGVMIKRLEGRETKKAAQGNQKGRDL